MDAGFEMTNFRFLISGDRIYLVVDYEVMLKDEFG